ncbi:hypothetical protein RhiJN_05484 [Ceratobasidium sp. AG-Ba]|nr:hypothetical protein RhiJN_05484 [Ceratobasidium sp. AG-Ba]
MTATTLPSNPTITLPSPNAPLLPGADTLPIIDIAPYLPNAPKGNVEARAKVAEALHAACRDFGFFYLDISAFVDRDQTDELAELAHRFFKLDNKVKEGLHIQNQDLARGYQRLGENITQGKADQHEGLDFYAPVAKPDKTRPLWGENQWPSEEDLPRFKRAYEAWIEKMKELGMIVMEAMAHGLGMTPDEWADLRGKIDDSFWVMRVIGYPPLSNEADGISCGAHKDYGCLTFLFADPTPKALQVFKHASKANVDEAGPGEWINADPIPGCVVCNIGEMWEVWTNGLYKSTIHRVIHRGTNYRVSVPFFFEPNFDAVVKPLPAALRLAETSKEQLAEPVVYGEFLYKKVASNFVLGKGRYD